MGKKFLLQQLMRAQKFQKKRKWETDVEKIRWEADNPELVKEIRDWKKKKLKEMAKKKGTKTIID